MVVLKTSGELAKMKKAGSLAAQALRAGGAAVRPGVTTGEIDRIIKHYIVSRGATPSFWGMVVFRAARACLSTM